MTYTLVRSAEDLGEVANKVAQAPVIGLDIETTSLSPLEGEIRIVSLDTGQGVYVVDLFDTHTLGPLVDALATTKAITVGQGLKFDQKWLLYKHQLELGQLFDTHRASEILHNGKNHLGHNLYDLYHRELGIEPKAPDMGGMGWSGPLSQEHYDYAAEDVTYLRPLRDALKPKLAQAGLNTIAALEFNVVLPEGAVELNGFFLDSDLWLALAQENTEKAAELREQLYRELPGPSDQISLPGFLPTYGKGRKAKLFNLDSPKQLIESLRRYGIPDKDLSVTEEEKVKESTSATVLAMCAARFPIVNKVLEYRGYSKSVSSFGPDYLDHINKHTGRIHCDYYAFLATGRYSASRPNLAQIPRDERFRSCFRAAPGKKLVSADYGAVEMRGACEVSGDAQLRKIFQDVTQDPHKYTAAFINDVSEDQVTKAMRQAAKAVNFGLCIAEGQRVLTHVGAVPIELVEDWHLVWDGVEWVSHGGVVYMGLRQVMAYDGLVATPDHEVYTDAGFRIPIREVASSIHLGRIAVGAVQGVPVGYDEFDRRSRGTRRQSSLHRGVLFSLREEEVDSHGQYTGEEDYELRVPEEEEVWGRPKSRGARNTLRCHGAAMSAGHPSEFSSLQGEGDQSAVQVSRALRSLGVRDLPRSYVQGFSVRSSRQQRSLLSGESSTDHVLGEQPKQGVLTRVYDLRNAGPRSRFTVEGKVVSNCFGMGPEKLVVYAQANYGVALTLAEARKSWKRYFEKFTGVKQWHQRALEEGKRNPITRTIGGRLRYLFGNAHNEFLNSPIQGTCADGMKVALRLVYNRLKPFGPQVKMVHHVHDEIILEVDDDPELIVAVQHELEEGMKEGMGRFIRSIPVTADASSGDSWATAKA